MDNITNMSTNPSSGYPKEGMMDNITKMNTNPSSGYPKEEMMDNIANMNTNPSYGYPKEDMMERVRVHLGYIVHHFLFRIPRGRVRAQRWLYCPSLPL
jgi:hypothetical protein